MLIETWKSESEAWNNEYSNFETRHLKLDAQNFIHEARNARPKICDPNLAKWCSKEETLDVGLKLTDPDAQKMNQQKSTRKCTRNARSPNACHKIGALDFLSVFAKIETHQVMWERSQRRKKRDSPTLTVNKRIAPELVREGSQVGGTDDITCSSVTMSSSVGPSCEALCRCAASACCICMTIGALTG